MKSRRNGGVGLFVAEGIKLCCEAAGSGRPVEQLCVPGGRWSGIPGAGGADREGLRLLSYREGVEQKIADTAAPPGVYCLCQLPRSSPFLWTPRGRYLLLVSLQDPGNVGTILRSCEAFGVTALLVTEDCPDLYSPKVLRSTMGSVFRCRWDGTPTPSAGADAGSGESPSTARRWGRAAGPCPSSVWERGAA